MAKGKKTGGRDFQPGHKFSKGRPRGKLIPLEVREIRGEAKVELEALIIEMMGMTEEELNGIAGGPTATMAEKMIASVIIKTINRGDVFRFAFLLDRIIGKPEAAILPPTVVAPTDGGGVIDVEAKMTFEQFCENAGYPQPFLKQLEMKEFVFDNPKQDPRLILGARGYGKTDYITILGVAYQIYLNSHEDTTLIVTKSRDRNASILSEIRTACEKNGVTFERANASRLRVEGLIGKDDSVSAVTIKSVSLRGRHPKRVILDDPVTPDDNSEATRKQVKRIYDEIVKLTKNVSIIGQPVHKLDLYQNLRPLVQKMEVPYGSIPELDADLEAQRMAGVDEASIQASYFLNIVSDGATPFENIKYIDEMPIEPGKNTVAFIDPAFGGTDYTAITIMCGYMQGVAVVGFAWQRSWEHCLDEIVELCERYNVGRMAFETNKTGEQPLDVIRTALKVRNLRLGLVGIWSNTNKHSRIMAAGTYAHLIHLCKKSNQAYTDQTKQYEQGAKNDDAPDSLASCMTWLGLIRGKENKGDR